MESFNSKKLTKIRRNSNYLDLKARIYDQGFTLETLPSVQRPGPTFPGLQPLSVRVSSKNQSLIPVIYQSQPSILHKTSNQFFQKKRNMNKFQKFHQELEDKQDKDEQNLNINNPQFDLTTTNFNANPIKNVYFEPLNETLENNRQSNPIMRKSMNKILPALEPPMQIQGLTINTTSNFFKSSSNTRFLETLRKNSPGFDLEARQSKYLLDKISGKFDIDKRYMKPNLSVKEEESIKFDQSPTKQENVSMLLTKNRASFENKPGLGLGQWETYKRPATKVDKYIELILKNVSNLDEFIYLYHNKDDEDPYNLEIIEYEVLKDEGLKEYSTISKKGLCHYENGKPNEFIPLSLWLKERETYDRIKSLKFFKKFRKWKTLKMWKRNVIRHKRIKYKKSLEEGLFFLSPRFRQSLILHRTNCMEMEKLRFLEISQQQYGITPETPKLEEFQDQQARKREMVKEKIREFSNKCRENVKSCFKDNLELLRKQQNGPNLDPFEEELKKKTEIHAYRLKETAYENLGFDDELSYEKRSQLRKECSKFLRFAYLIDFLTLDSLKNIYLYSVDDLLNEMCFLNRVKDNLIYREKAQKGSSKFREPLFYLTINDCFDREIEKNQIKQQILSEFMLPPLGNSQNQDFNILCHVFVKPVSQAKKKTKEETDENQEDEEEDIDIYDENKKYNRNICPNLYRIWLEIKPNLDEFMAGIMKSIEEGKRALQVFERWSRHDDMTPYVNILEEWDDMVGDDWEMPDSNYLDPNDILENTNRFVDTLKEILQEAFQRCDKYLESFNEFLMIYWENSLVNMELFKNPRIVRESESIHNALNLLNYQKDLLENNVPFQADLGLFRIDSTNIREMILPSPEALLKKFQNILPEQLRVRSRELRDWLTVSTQTMKAGIGNLEDFVKQRNAVRVIEHEYPNKKKKLDTLNQISFILKDKKIDLKKDDDQLLVDINHLSVNMTMTLGSVMEALEKGMESNALKISKQLIPELVKAVNDLDYQVKDARFINKDITQDQAISDLEKFQREFQKLDMLGVRYQDFQRVLGLEVAQFEELRNLKEELEIRLNMWRGLKDWSGLIETWVNGRFSEINPEEIMSKAEYYTNIVRRAQKKLPGNLILDELKSSVFDFKDAMPVITALRNKHLKEHHWKDIKELISGLQNIEEMTLKELIGLNVGKMVKEIQEISTQASQEAVLEREFEQIMAKWMLLEFTVSPYKSDKTKDLFVLTDIDELFVNLDELLAALNNILGSRYLKNLRTKAEELHRKLLYAQETIDDWLICQKNWIYLENIFDAQDIKKKMQNESNQFETVDKSFRSHMRKTNQFRILNRCLTSEIGKMFKKHKETLNLIQKALENYLEQKRINFPRFYFLSNDELLEILANAANLPAIQKHMKKCFDNIYRLNTGEDPKGNSIIGMISGEGEKVDFNKQVSIRSGDIEHWLNLVQDQMRESISKRMKIGKNEIENKERKKWVQDHPGQVVATISQATWCSTTEYFLDQMQENSNSLAEWFQMNFVQLAQLTELVREALDSIKHRIIVALITQDVHARDIIETLTNDNVTSKNDFQWQQQLRYYWDETLEKENIYVCQINAKLKYGYEYMGATSRLVITPLTDRCWITITGALNIKLGASPAGPAGTGKTESTKDLAKALGMFCVVFNCSEQIEHRMMARLFSGLAQQGAWSCLDEFNRIDIEVLSVIAQQLLVIRQANLKNEKKFFFINDVIQMREGFGVFITMNPGYAGRTELPDNLKVLFRPVSMMIPDYRLIAEIILFSEGFEDSKVLSNKMVQLYKLSSEQLSQQKHYDFGMRAVKSVLVMAGSLKRSDPNSNEDGVLIKAMRDSNIPKFLKEDIPLFQALIQDLFPDVLIPKDDYLSLTQMIEKGCKELGLQIVDKLTTKVIQLFETFNVRFGVMLVGFTGSGKTACFQLLQYAMNELRRNDIPDQRFQIVHTYILNPKCIAMGELYGEVNQFTDEWQDGLASKIMREIAVDESPDKKNDRHWVVFDGPVDALWIENMNTVLDDNMMLCLANGQRIKLRNEMRMLFEVNDLKVASPATVSRCGMVFMTTEELGWKPYVLSWIDRLLQNSLIKENKDNLEATEGEVAMVEFVNKEFKGVLIGLFDDVINDLLKFLRSGIFNEPINTTDLQLVISLCNLLDCFLTKLFGFKIYENPEYKKKFILFAFAFACIWSVGASITEESHHKFDDFIRKKFVNILFPQSDTVFGFYMDSIPMDLSFKPWSEKIRQFLYLKDSPYFNLMVQTNDTARYSFILEWLLIFEKKPFMTGGTGVGKSMIIKTLLQEIQPIRSIDPIYLMFSAATESNVIQMTIENKLEKFKKTLYGAKPGRKAVIFIDDINMPAVEQYGAQPPIELLRLMIDKGGFYDRKDKFWKEIQNTTVLAAAAPPTGGRNQLTPRFTRHFNLLCMPQPNQKTLFQIFHSIIMGFFTVNNFNDCAKRISDNVVQATIEVYSRIIKEKKAIPSKFFYTFNLRDLSKVFQGILMVKSYTIKETENMVRLWVHETSRVFHDRLISQEDRIWFNTLIIELLAKEFNMRWTYEEIFEGNNKILFGDLLKLDTSKDYEEIKDMKKLLKVFSDKLDDYNYDNNNKTKMNLVFFEDAIEHILRSSRVLRQPRGNLMLIGVGGSGKQSLTRLSSFVMGYTMKQIELTKGFNEGSFREFLRELLQKTGLDGEKITFLFNDSQIQDSFLEDINNLLNSGEVPNIWEQQEDKDKIIASIRPIHVNVLKRDDTPDQIYATFVERVRDCLHIVLCLSPIGDGLRVRCRKFPSLVDCCTLDWFAPWPEDALLSVAANFLAEVSLNSEEMRNSLVTMCKEVHVSAIEQTKIFEDRLKRKIFITPKSYLDYLQLYVKLLEEKRESLSSNIKRLTTGVNQLINANSLVSKLKIDLTQLQPQLEVQSQEMAKALKTLEKDSIIALEQELLVSKEREEINKQAQEIKQLTDDAQSDLDIVKPELEAAETAIKNIDEKQIATMRTYPAPPQIVEDVMAGVCILFNKKYEWAAAKSLMLNLNVFINNLLNYPKDTIKDDTLIKLRKHKNNPNVCFKPEEIKARAPAAADLCMWCIAMDTYATVSKKVAPKKAKVAALQGKLEAANQILLEKEREVAKVKANVNKLKEESDLMLQKKIETEHLIQKTMIRLENAGSLTSLLKEEGERWAESIKNYEEETITVVGDMFLATGCLNYCSAFTGLYRQELLSKWVIGMYSRNVPLSSENPSIVKILGTPILIRDWIMNGLPSDTVSLENAIFAHKGFKYPLFIDPQVQAKKWLKRAEEANNLKLMKFSDNQFQTNMKAALTLGYPVLIQDTEDILDPVLDTILNKTFYKNADGRTSIRFADQDVDFSDGFRLFITTKLPNPDYLPDIFIKCNVINFTVTFDGLEEQLLADVVKHEKPNIESERDENIVNLSGFRKKIIDSENMILRLLSEARSDTLLDDTNLIKTLQISKAAAIEIDKQIKASVELEETIEKARNQYKDVSIRGSVLYFVIKDLALIDPMYQYSLQYINKLFNNAIHAAASFEELHLRIEALIDTLTKHIFTNVCRGLFEEHKLIFSFLISVNIQKQAKLLEEGLWSLFLRGLPQISTEKKQNIKSPDPHIPVRAWEMILYLHSNYPNFSTFPQEFPHYIEPFHEYLLSLETNEPIDFPEPWTNVFDEFDKLLTLNILHPEKLMFGISNYINKTMGKFYLESPEVGMNKLYNDSDCKTPIIFVLSQGADPTDSIIAYAKENNFEENLHIISLGQGQGPLAAKMIEVGKETGSWVFLQNCHLARTWMPALEIILEEINNCPPEQVNSAFRLILTSMPTTYFPISVLQNGIKLTTEPPRGIKANLRRTFADINNEFLNSCNKGPKIFHKMLWGLAYFHSIVLERRKFGPLGWNIRYEFNDSDLSTSKTVLLMLLNEQEQIPWDALIFVTGHINYGGRVTDDWDRRCLLSILKKFYLHEALDDNYRFCESDFYIPNVSDLASYKDYIEALPINDDPEIFGLHANANISYQSQEAQRIISSLLMVEPRVSGAGGGSTGGSKNDETILKLIEVLAKELPEALMKENGNKELFQENEFGLIPSLSTVLLQEIERFNKLMNKMRGTMQALAGAIQGLGLMSQDLDDMYFSLLLNQVPKIWEEVAYPSLKPLASWITDLKERLKFMTEWLLNGNPNCFWMSGFYFPQGFLTGVLQTHARKYKIPIDQLQFTFRVMEDKENIFGKPLDGVYVYGLFLVGASWDRKKKMLMNQIDGEMNFKMPVIHFNPTENYEAKASDYLCPVYKTSLRRGVLSTTGQSTNYILAVDLPSPDDYVDYWTLKGTALLSQLDD